MKRVLVFSLAYFPNPVGGAEIAIKEITDRCPEYEFHMVTLRFDSSLPAIERIGNVIVHRIGLSRPHPSASDLKQWPLHFNKYYFQIAAFFYGAWLHRTLCFDLLWAMMAHSSGIPAGLFKLFFPRVRYVLTLQEGDPPEAIERMMRPVWPLFSRAFASADIVTAISNFLGIWARRRGFKGRLEIIPNAVDVARFSREYPRAEIDAVEPALGKRAGDILLITTSRLVRKNAVDDVIRALPMLPDRVRFAVLGVGPDEAMLKKLAGDLGVAHRVRFLGQVGHDELPKYLKASDIFIRPSRSEGMGNSFIEAMAADLSVVATQEGGIADFLFDEKRNPEKPSTGFAVDADSPRDIARAVQEVIENPEKARAARRAARALVEERYDWDIVARTMRERAFAIVSS